MRSMNSGPRPQIGAVAVQLRLAGLAGSAADGDILERTAKTAHRMALEVGQHQHGIIVEQVLAHGHFLEVPSAGDGQGDVAVGIHDVHRAEGPAVGPQGLAVAFRGLAGAGVEDVALHDGALRDAGLQGPHHVARQDVGAVGLTGMELDGDAPLQRGTDLFVDAQQALRGDLGREVHGGLILCGAGLQRQAVDSQGAQGKAARLDELSPVHGHGISSVVG